MKWQVIDFNTGEGKLFENEEEAQKYFDELRVKFFEVGYMEFSKIKIEKVGI